MEVFLLLVSGRVIVARSSQPNSCPLHVSRRQQIAGILSPMRRHPASSRTDSTDLLPNLLP